MTTTDPRTTGRTHTTLRAEGFTCPSCVAKIEKRVGALPGVSNVKVQFASSRIEVDHDPQVTGVDQLVTEVAKACAGVRSSNLPRRTACLCRTVGTRPRRRVSRRASAMGVLRPCGSPRC